MSSIFLGLASGEASIDVDQLELAIGDGITELLYVSTPRDFELNEFDRNQLNAAISQMSSIVSRRNPTLTINRGGIGHDNDRFTSHRASAIEFMLRYNLEADRNLQNLRSNIPEMFEDGRAIYKHEHASLHPQVNEYTPINIHDKSKTARTTIYMQSHDEKPSRRTILINSKEMLNKMSLIDRPMMKTETLFGKGEVRAIVQRLSAQPQPSNHSIERMAAYLGITNEEACQRIARMPTPGKPEIITFEDGGNIIPETKPYPTTFLMTFVRQNENTIIDGVQLRIVYKGVVRTDSYIKSLDSDTPLQITPTFMLTVMINETPILKPRASGIPIHAVRRSFLNKYGTPDYYDMIDDIDVAQVVKITDDPTLDDDLTFSKIETKRLAKSILKTNQWLNIDNTILNSDTILGKTEYLKGTDAKTDRVVNPYTVTGPDFSDIDKLSPITKQLLASTFTKTLKSKLPKSFSGVSITTIDGIIAKNMGASIVENEDIRSPEGLSTLLQTRRIKLDDILTRWILSCFMSITSRVLPTVFSPPVLSHSARTALMKIPYCVSSKGTLVYEMTDTFMPLLKHIKLSNTPFTRTSLGARLAKYTQGDRMHVSSRSKHIGIIHSMPEAISLKDNTGPSEQSHFTLHGATTQLNFDKMIADMCNLLTNMTTACFVWHPRYCIIVSREGKEYYAFVIPSPRASTVIPTNHSPSQVTRIVNNQTLKVSPSIGYLTQEEWLTVLSNDVRNAFRMLI